jgi:hypothetical protein
VDDFIARHATWRRSFGYPRIQLLSQWWHMSRTMSIAQICTHVAHTMNTPEKPL